MHTSTNHTTETVVDTTDAEDYSLEDQGRLCPQDNLVTSETHLLQLLRRPQN